MNVRHLKFTAAVIGMVAVGIGSYYWAGKNKIEPAGSRARIAHLNGSVTLKGQPALLGKELDIGASLLTGAGSSAVLGFENRAMFRAGEKTELMLMDGAEPIRIKLVRGWLMNLVRSGIKYQVATDASVAASRGTVFFVWTESPSETYVCVCKGKITVQSGGTEKQVQSEHHLAVTVTRKQDRSLIRPAPMQRHTDQDVKSLEITFRGRS